MRKFFWTVASAAVFVAVPAFAQDASTDTGAVETADGTRAFGIEPYVGIIGGYERFDDEVTHSGIPVPAGQNYKGGLIEGVAGVNVPLGPVFAGVEGSVAKGFTGDIDWEYGAAGRFGVRAGDTGLFYGKVGYRWVNFDALGPNSGDYGEMVYGVGTEFAPAGKKMNDVRVRLEVDTYGDAHSFRPMAGLIAQF
ncbi:outer membrane immunogenic protein [Hephaestia caeni]|uniref:Outer membrane immunogenic protein n=1 Tax=Hephaestia caeni TaxID=645617 RepID=A0A397NPR0_9SPHN|nr:opacity protein [Hephaestia caeni]RIA37653.1 outer membrane immunogenic protein [Hephaestia caeni]